jgi:PST family polysaccharide transporter
MTVAIPAATRPAASQSSASRAPSLAERTVGGTVWSVFAFATQRGLALLTTVVLARILVPSDFGQVSFAMVVIGALTLIQDLGTSAAIVYDERDTASVRGTALTLNVAAGLALFALTALVSPLITRLGGQESAGSLVTVLGLGLVLTSLGTVQSAVLTRDLAFRRKFLADVVPLVVSGAVSLVTALAGLGAWSLVYGYLARCASTAALLWYVSDVRPWPRFSPTIALELLRYGRHVSLASVLGFLFLNVDYFLIGRTLGAHELGLYTLAYLFGTLPSTAIGQQTFQVLFAAYARTRADGARLERMFSDAYRVIAALSVPLGMCLFIGAETLVALTLGDSWRGVVAPLRILVVFGVLRSIEHSFFPVYRAIGRADLLWKLNLVRLGMLVPLMAAVASRGIEAVAVVQVAVTLCYVPLNGIMLSRHMGFPMRRLLDLLLPSVIAGAAGTAAALVTSLLLPGSPAPAAAGVGRAALAVAVYVPILVALDKRVFQLVRARSRFAWAR